MPWIEQEKENPRQVPVAPSEDGWKPLTPTPGDEDNELLWKLAKDSDPDNVAKAERMSKETGLPVDSLLRNPDLLKEAATKASVKFKPDAPKTTAFLKKPENFVQAHDDIPALSGVEKVLKNVYNIDPKEGEKQIKDAWQGVIRPAGQQLIRFGPFVGKSIYDTAGLLSGTVKYLADMATKMSGGHFLFDGWSKAAGAAEKWSLKNAQVMSNLMNQKALLPSKKVQESGILEHPELLKNPEWWTYNTLGLGHYLGLGAAGGAIPLAASFAGDMYDQLIQEGASNDQALTAAYLFGMGSEVLSHVGLDKYLKGVEGKTLLTRLAKRTIKAMEGGTIATAFGPLSAATRDIGLGASLDQLGKDTKKALEHSIDIFPAAFLTGMALHAPVQYLSAGDRADSTYKSLDQLNQAAAIAKLKERNPEKFQEFLENIVSPDQSVFITPEGFRTLFQNSDVAQDVLGKLGMAQGEARAYMDSQQDRDVPLAEFLAKLNPDEIKLLQPHTKFNPSDISYAEAQNNEHVEDYQRVQQVLNDTYFNRLKERERFRTEVSNAYDPEYADAITRLVDRWSLNFPEDTDIYKKLQVTKDPTIVEDKGAEAFAQNFSVRVANTFDEQAKLHEENGGSTFDANGRDLGGQPFLAFSLFKPLEAVTEEPVTPESLKKYYLDHLNIFQKYPETTLGTWTDPETGKTYYDISILAPRDKMDESLEFAKQAKQLEIFDLQTLESHKTGYNGSEGDTPDLSVDEWMKLYYDHFPSAQKTLSQMALTPVNGKVTAFHWSSEPNLTTIDPSQHGRGIKGAESKRKKDDPEHWVDRSYYGLNGYSREPGLGPHKYTVELDADRMYDYTQDPDGLLEKTREIVKKDPFANFASVYEKLIKDAGYQGYYVDTPSSGPVAAVFEKIKPEGHTLEETFNQEAFRSLPPEEIANVINDLYSNVDLIYNGNVDLGDESGSLHSFIIQGDSKANGEMISVHDPNNVFSVMQEVKEAFHQAQDEPMPRKDVRRLVFWHGTGADFQHFSDEALRSGTGGMVFSAGHYVTEYDPVSKYYLHVTGRFFYDGIEFTPDQLRTVDAAKDLLTENGFSEEEAEIAGRLLSYIAMRRDNNIKPSKTMLKEAIDHWLGPIRMGVGNIEKALKAKDATNVDYWKERLVKEKANLARYEKEFKGVASRIKTRRIQYKTVLRPGEKTWLNWYDTTPDELVAKINHALERRNLPKIRTAFNPSGGKVLGKELEVALNDFFNELPDGILKTPEADFFRIDPQFDWANFEYAEENYDTVRQVEEENADEITKMRSEGASDEEVNNFVDMLLRSDYGEIYDTGMIYPEIKGEESVGAEDKYMSSRFLNGYNGQIRVFEDGRIEASVLFPGDGVEENVGVFTAFNEARDEVENYIKKEIGGWVRWDNKAQEGTKISPQDMNREFKLEYSGKQIYEKIQDILTKNPLVKKEFGRRSDVAASKFLNKEAGIDGVKYPVGTMSRKPRYDKFNYELME